MSLIKNLKNKDISEDEEISFKNYTNTLSKSPPPSCDKVSLSKSA